MLIENAVVSSDFSDRFLNSWPLVARAWKDIVGIHPVLALVATEHQYSTVSHELERHGLVVRVDPHPRIPLANQSKLARFFVAASLSGVSLIEDIDTVILSPTYVRELSRIRLPMTLLAVGHEVYLGTPYEGAFPISNMTGEPELFKELFGFSSLSFAKTLDELAHVPRSNPRQDVREQPGNFSDEQLIRAIFSSDPTRIPVTRARRRADGPDQLIDRSSWHVGEAELWSGKYESCNLPRPLHAFQPEVLQVVRYVMGRDAATFLEHPILPLTGDYRRRRSKKRPWITALP